MRHKLKPIWDFETGAPIPPKEKKPRLTWQDVKKIDYLLLEVITLFAATGRNKDIMEPLFYEEVARRFNETKK